MVEGSSTQVEVAVIYLERPHLALRQSLQPPSYPLREHQFLLTGPATTLPREDCAVPGTQVVFPLLVEDTDTRPCHIPQWLSTI